MKTTLQLWLKRIAYGFILLIALMGFFAKSLMTYTLPNVQVQKISSGTEVQSSSESWGTIVAKRSEHIVLNQDLVVETLYAKKGSYVKPGDPLFKIRLMDGQNASPKMLQSKINLLNANLKAEADNLKASHDSAVKALTQAEQRAAKDLEAQKSLYAGGAIAKETLDLAQRTLNDAQAALKQEDQRYSQGLASLKLRTTENALEAERLQNELAQAQRMAAESSEIGADGVIRAKNEGYMTAMPEEGRRYSAGEALATVGICHSYQDLCFEMRMSQRAYYQSAEGNSSLSITSEDGLNIGNIQFDYRHAALQDGEIVVQGDFTQEPDIWVFPGQKVASRTSSSWYIADEVMAIPRTAIVTTGSGIEGTGHLIYMIRTSDDALGKSTVAVATPVEVVGNTDDYAIVKDLDYMPSDLVILNPSARLHDGTKVYICQ